jgi:hypothetical protein
VQRVRARPIARFFSNLTPLFAALMSAAAFLGEGTASAFHAVAFALIVGGIVVSSRR